MVLKIKQKLSKNNMIVTKGYNGFLENFGYRQEFDPEQGKNSRTLSGKSENIEQSMIFSQENGSITLM